MTVRSLSQLLSGYRTRIVGDSDAVMALNVAGMALDSRQIVPGDAFFALRGTRDHGLSFVAEAMARGATVVLAETPIVDGLVLDVPVVWIDDLGARVSEIAARFYGHPSAALDVIGVTGTNGKTSTVQLLAQALEHLGHRTATIGTLGAGLHGHLDGGERTTPDAIAVQRLLADFRAAGATHVAMEVSSHALDQGRVAAVDFAIAAFTNLTRDHLDYHGSMEAYGAAKAKLVAMAGLRAVATNADDSFGAALAEHIATGATLIRFSAAGDLAAQVRADQIRTTAAGLVFQLHTPWGSGQVHSGLLGRFNVANLLTVVSCLGALGQPFAGIVKALKDLHPVNGRMNRVGGTAGEPLVVVDYAHTPDALEQALAALRPHCAGRLFCVFGCGGERDAGKRPLMGAIAARLADIAIVTDDNPRGEDGDRIVADIVAGMPASATTVLQRDRRAAITEAVTQATAADVVLIAGKGHETYQDDASGRHPFDDMDVARGALDSFKPGACA